jgi:uncharacterized phiE125 gp8 family phage protein
MSGLPNLTTTTGNSRVISMPPSPISTAIFGQALITQTWKVNLCGWPCDGIRLPLGPVQSVTTVKYYNSANSQATLSTANYALYTDALGPYIGWLHGYSVPSLYPRADAIEVTFVAGYGMSLKTFPRPFGTRSLCSSGTGTKIARR